jgi:hypothetical protein
MWGYVKKYVMFLTYSLFFPWCFAENYLEYEKAVMLHAMWLTSENSFNSGLDDTVARLYMSALTGMSSQLAESLITFDIPSLVTASGILWQVCYID